MTSHRFRLGEWLVDTAAGELRSGDLIRHLEPRLADILHCLASRAGQLVTKEELLDTVWGTRYVSDGAIFRHLSILRRALEDDVKAPRFIETVPKRGYRLIIPVTSAPLSTIRAITTEEVSRAVTPRRHALELAGLAALVGVGALLVLANRADPTRGELNPDDRRTRGAFAVAEARGTDSAQAFQRALALEQQASCLGYAGARHEYVAAVNGAPPFQWAHLSLIDARFASSVLGCEPGALAYADATRWIDQADASGVSAQDLAGGRAAMALWAERRPEKALAILRAAGIDAPREGDALMAAVLASLGRLPEALDETTRARGTPTPGASGRRGRMRSVCTSPVVTTDRPWCSSNCSRRIQTRHPRCSSSRCSNCRWGGGPMPRHS